MSFYPLLFYPCRAIDRLSFDPMPVNLLDESYNLSMYGNNINDRHFETSETFRGRSETI